MFFLLRTLFIPGLAILIDCREGRGGCWVRSLPLAKLLAGMPRQLQVLSEASLPNREVL